MQDGIERPIQRTSAGCGAAVRDLEVLADRERCEDPAPLRDERDAGLRNAIGREPRDTPWGNGARFHEPWKAMNAPPW